MVPNTALIMLEKALVKNEVSELVQYRLALSTTKAPTTHTHSKITRQPQPARIQLRVWLLFAPVSTPAG